MKIGCASFDPPVRNQPNMAVWYAAHIQCAVFGTDGHTISMPQFHIWKGKLKNTVVVVPDKQHIPHPPDHMHRGLLHSGRIHPDGPELIGVEPENTLAQGGKPNIARRIPE